MPNPRKLTSEQEAELVAAYLAGDPVGDIVVKYQVSAGTVRACVKRSGNVLRPIGHPRITQS